MPGGPKHSACFFQSGPQWYSRPVFQGFKPLGRILGEGLRRGGWKLKKYLSHSGNQVLWVKEFRTFLKKKDFDILKF